MRIAHKISPIPPRRRSAFTLLESMLLVAILGMTAAVVGQSLLEMSNSAVENNVLLQVNDALLNQMEILRSTYTTVSPAPTLSTPWTSTSTVTYSGRSYTVTSKIACAVPTGSTAQTNFLLLQVTIGNDTMCTYVSE